MRQIAGYDISPIVNLAYRGYLGQVFHLDFFSPFPPVFTHIAKLGIEYFGQSWSSFVWMGVAIYVSSCLLIYFLFSRSSGASVAALIALHCFCATGLLMGYVWYGSLTLLLIAILIGLLSLSAKRSKVVDLAIVAFLALMLMSKPNMSFPMFVLSIAWLALPEKFCGEGRWRFAVVAMLTSVLVAFVYSIAIEINPFAYIDSLRLIVRSRSTEFLITVLKVFEKLAATPVVEWYSIAGSIGLWARVVLSSLVGFVLIGLLFVSTGIHIKKQQTSNERERRHFGLSIITAFVGLVSVATNADFPQASYPLFMMSLSLCGSWNQGGFCKHALTMLILAFSLELALFGVMRERVKAAGEGSFWEPDSTLVIEHQGFFKGVSTGPALIAFQREVQSFITNGGSKHIFFGPRVEFGYAAFGVYPPKQLPLWFHPGLSWPLRAENGLIDRWVSHSFDVVILFRNDSGEMPERLKEIIRNEYELRSPEFGFANASIWVKK